MTLFQKLILLSSVWELWGASLFGEPLELTLEQAVQRAQQNYGLQRSRLQLENRSLEISKQQGVFIPRLQVTSSQSFQDPLPGQDDLETKTEESALSIIQEVPYGGEVSLAYRYQKQTFSSHQSPELESDFIEVPKQDSFQKSMELTYRHQLLKNGLAAPLFASIRLAKLDYAAQQESLSQTEIDLIQNVKIVFYDTLIQQELVRINRDVFTISTQLLELVQKRFEAGFLSRQDIMIAEIEFSNSQNTLFVSQENLKQAMEQLQNLLGTTAPLVVRTSLDQNELQDLKDLIALSLINHPQIKQLEHELQSSRLSLKIAENQQLPELSLFLNYSQTGMGGSFQSAEHQKQKNYSIGFNFSIPFYHQVEKSQFQQARLAVQIKNLELQELKQTLENSIKRIYQHLLSLEKRIAFQKQNKETVQKILNNTIKALEAGLIDLERTYTARDRVLSTEKNWLSLQLDYQQKWTKLDALVSGKW